MAFSLTEYKKQSTDPLIAGVYEAFLNNSPLMSKMLFTNINGGSVSWNTESVLPTTSFRAVNSDYSTSAGTVNKQTEDLTIVGGKITADRALLRMYGQDRLNTDIAMQLKSLARLVNYTMFKGSGGSDDFTGLQTRIQSGQTIDNGTAALSLASFDEAIANLEGENKYCFVGTGLWLRLTAALRNNTLAGNLFRTNDDLGKPMMVYGDVPILQAGKDASDSEILDFSETSATGSAYFVSLDDNGIQGVQNGEIQRHTPVTDSFASEFDIEWIMNYIIGNPNSAYRVSNILDAAVTA